MLVATLSISENGWFTGIFPAWLWSLIGQASNPLVAGICITAAIATAQCFSKLQFSVSVVVIKQHHFVKAPIVC